MLEQIFTSLTRALGGAPAIAVPASFAWGILSILLSPCHLAGIPLIVAFVGAQGGKLTVKKAFLTSLLFAAGILITITLLGVITGLAGRIAGDLGIWGSVIMSVILLAIGLHLMGIISLPFFNAAIQPQYEKKGYWAAFMLGLVFGIALGPCTFAFMAPMLAIAFSVAAKNLIFSILLVTAYAAGHCSVIVLAGTFTEVVEKYMRWGEKSNKVVWLKKICGGLIFLAGIYFAWGMIG